MPPPSAVAETEASLARQREALEALLATLTEGAREAEEKLRALGAAAGEADGAAAQLIRETGPELVDTLVRVRDAANQAAAHAREAIAAVIPDSVHALVEASRARSARRWTSRSRRRSPRSAMPRTWRWPPPRRRASG